MELPKRHYRGKLIDKDVSNVRYEHYILSCGHEMKNTSTESSSSFHYQIILNEKTLQLPRIPVWILILYDKQHQQIGGNHFFNCPLGHITQYSYELIYYLVNHTVCHLNFDCLFDLQFLFLYEIIVLTNIHLLYHSLKHKLNYYTIHLNFYIFS